MKRSFGFWTATVALGMLLSLNADWKVVAQAQQYVARSRVNWLGFGVDNVPVPITGRTRGGTYTLGKNEIRFIDVPNGAYYSTGPVNRDYAADAGTSNGLPLTRSYTIPGVFPPPTTTCKADSTMTVGAKAGAFYPWRLDLEARSDTDPFSADGYATARGKDPQLIDQTGVFSGSFSLAAGSSLFGSRPGTDLATSDLQITAPNLGSTPMVSIDLSAGKNHQINATVKFADDSHLRFYVPGTTTLVTEQEVETTLRNLSGFNTLAGTTGNVNLFTFVDDLTGLSLPSDAAFGASAEVFANSTGVPEPSALTVGLGMLSLVGFCRPRRTSKARSRTVRHSATQDSSRAHAAATAQSHPEA